jgi:galactonate dehydratase
MAIAAVDTALWDLKARLLDQPLCRLLGMVHDQVAVYGSGGFTSLTDAELVAQLTGWAQGQRIPRVKLKVGTAWGSRPGRDLERVARVREALGDEVEIIVDVHTRLDPPDALLLCRELEDCRPFFVEDPLRAEGSEGYRQLRARTGVPLAAGEQFGTKWEFRTLIDEDLVDFVRPDLGIAGGITEARKIAGWAEGHFIRTATHNPLGPVMTAACTHFNTACANFGIQEQYDHGQRPDLDHVFSLRPVITDGRAIPSESPGLGVDVDRSAARDLTARALERPHLQRPDGSFTNW